MYERLKLLLEEAEYSALYDLAQRELRDPASQAQFLIRQLLRRRGLLPEEGKKKIEVEKTERVEAC